MARRRGSNEQCEQLLVEAVRGGPGALSGSGSGGPAARAAAAAALGGVGRRAAETMVSAGSLGESALGSPGGASTCGAGSGRCRAVLRERPLGPGSVRGAAPDAGGRGRGGFCGARRRSRCRRTSSESLALGYVMPLLRIGGVLVLPTSTARSVRVLYRHDAITGLFPDFFATGLYLCGLKYLFILQFSSS